MTRYTPKGVWAETYSDQQRSDIISQVLGDGFYQKHLHPGIIRCLQSENADDQNRGLISVHKFEDRVDFLGGRESFELSKLTPAQREAREAKRVREAQEKQDRQNAERLLSLAPLPDGIKAKLASPKLDTVRKGIRLATEWLQERKIERDQAALARALAPLFEAAEPIYARIEDLLSRDLTSERRAKLQEFYDTLEDHCDDPIRLTAWIDRAQFEIDRTTHKLAKRSETATPPERATNWAAQDAKKVIIGNPNPQGFGAPKRGQAVALAGKTSQELTRKGKKKTKK